MIQDCFFQFRDVGLDLTSIEQWQVTGCEFYNVSDGYNVGGDCVHADAVDISIADANIVAITGCRFNRTNATSAPNRVNILLNPPVITPPGTSAKRLLIAHNQFGDRVAGGGNFGVSAVQIKGTASHIHIGDNQYIGAYSGPVIDDQTTTRAVVATLGYPTTNTAGSAVVPSGNSTIGQPTLGTGPNPWPASFSFGHYLPVPGAIPSTPDISWGGWVIYTDFTDGNKLKAKYQNGTTIVTLASP